MMTIFIAFYIMMAIIVASFAFVEIVGNGRKRWGDTGVDAADFFFYTLGALGLGAVWFITIWIGCLLWYISDETPFWGKMLIDIIDFIKKRTVKK